MTKGISEASALLIALTGYASWCITDASIKGATSNPIPIFEVLCIANFAMLLAYGGQILIKKNIKDFKPKKPIPVMIRAALLVISALCNYIALPLLPLATFYAIIFTSPILIALGGIIFLHEPLSWKKALIILASFAGVVIAIDPTTVSLGSANLIGCLATAGSALAFSATQIIGRRISQTETAESLVFMSTLFCFVTGLIGSIGSFQIIGLIPLGLIVLAGLANLVGNTLAVVAIRHARAASVASLHYSQLVIGAILGFIFWGDVPTVNLIIGAALIIGSGLLMVKEVRA